MRHGIPLACWDPLELGNEQIKSFLSVTRAAVARAVGVEILKAHLHESWSFNNLSKIESFFYTRDPFTEGLYVPSKNHQVISLLRGNTNHPSLLRTTKLIEGTIVRKMVTFTILVMSGNRVCTFGETLRTGHILLRDHSSSRNLYRSCIGLVNIGLATGFPLPWINQSHLSLQDNQQTLFLLNSSLCI